MNMIYTSRYANKELVRGTYTPVRISLGTPRWPLGYTLAGAIKELMPWGIKDIEDVQEFRKRYFAQLERYGVERIGRQINRFKESGRDVVLLCYEDIRKGPSYFCHRTMFAEWWLGKTGQMISELEDNSKFVPEKTAETGMDEMSLF